MKAASDKAQELEHIILQPLKVRFGKIFGRYTLENTRVDVNPFLHRYMDEVELQITTNILGQSHKQTYVVTVDVPNTWRDQFLHEMRWKWLSRQLQRVSPIRWRYVFREVTFNHWALLPEFDKLPPGEEVVLFTSIPGNEPGIRKFI